MQPSGTFLRSGRLLTRCGGFRFWLHNAKDCLCFCYERFPFYSPLLLMKDFDFLLCTGAFALILQFHLEPESVWYLIVEGFQIIGWYCITFAQSISIQYYKVVSVLPFPTLFGVSALLVLVDHLVQSPTANKGSSCTLGHRGVCE